MRRKKPATKQRVPLMRCVRISFRAASRSVQRRCSPIRKAQKLAFLRDAQAQGYVIVLVFIGLESSELAIGRVLERTERGGHDVPNAKIESRFPRTFANLLKALTFVDHAFLFDNSSAEQPYRFVAKLRAGRIVRRGGTRPQWWVNLGL